MMAKRAGSVIAAEAGGDRVPGLLAGVMSLGLAPQRCSLGYWLGVVARGMLPGLVSDGRVSASGLG